MIEIQSTSQKLSLEYGCYPHACGTMLIALHQDSLCFLAFVTDNPAFALQELTEQWQPQEVTENQTKITFFGNALFKQSKPVKLLVKGTSFQVKVWRALAALPGGKTTTYQAIAHTIGNPKAVRAVGSAVGHNPIAYIIPCHRVILKSGKVHNYRWGREIKKQLLEIEASR